MSILYAPMYKLEENCITIDYDVNYKHMSLKNLWEYFITFPEIINITPLEIIDFLNVCFMNKRIYLEGNLIIKKVKIIRKYCLKCLKNLKPNTEKYIDFIAYLIILTDVLNTFFSN